MTTPLTRTDLDEALESFKQKLDDGFVTRVFLEEALDDRFESFRKEIVLSLASEIARSAAVMMEHMTSLFRVADDRVTAVADRVTAVETRLDDHVADAALHRAPRRSRRR